MSSTGDRAISARASCAAHRCPSPERRRIRVRLLTPTENRRLNELIGFLGMTLAVLMALALLSYSPHDASFNVSAQPPDGDHPARNWIGPVGRV